MTGGASDTSAMPDRPRLIVVLGMHRSGTSVIARGLAALGVALGDELTDGGAMRTSENPKGFWEDVDVHEINVAVLRSLGIGWDAPRLIAPDELTPAALESWHTRAVEIIRRKLDRHPLLAITNPRTTRLVPFWERVFATVGCRADYVIGYRHPASVACSLEARNGFLREKSDYLWLAHLVPGVLDTRGARRVLVAYDALVDRPDHELARIARALDLAAPPAAALADFRERFLDAALRHTCHRLGDLDDTAPRELRDACTLLEAVARDEMDLESRAVGAAFEAIAEHLYRIAPALRCIATVDHPSAVGVPVADAKAAAAARDTALEHRNRALAERDAALTERNAARIARDAAETRTNAALAQRDAVLARRDAVRAEVTALEHSPALRAARALAAARAAIHTRAPSYPRLRSAVRGRLLWAFHKLPPEVRTPLRAAYVRYVREPSRLVVKRIRESAPFRPPAMRPAPLLDGRPDYLVWGVIDWHFRQQRPQHLARALAASGRRVFYVATTWVDDERAGFRLKPLDAEGRLFEITLYAARAGEIYTAAPGIDVVAQLRRSIGELLLWAGAREVVSLVQHPFWYEIATAIPNGRVIYDCMDHHEGFGNTAPAILSLERALLRDADLTITTSAWLERIVTDQTRRHALIRNAADVAHFAERPPSVYADPDDRPIIGYYGAIAEWFDVDLVAAVAARHPECAVVLVGADTANAAAALAHLPNVTFTGEVPYAELPYYLHAFRVCILPFTILPLTRATNPVKIYEYLSAGKPIVTVDLPEMAHFGDLIQVRSTTEAFVDAVSQALREPDDPDAVARRRAFAARETWTHRARALVAAAEDELERPRVSVVVVTYENLALTRACLASLEQRSAFTTLEIIVVDNASTDGSRAFLSEWARGGPDRVLILNDDNKGFAAANNQGLAAATGEYLALLNNDTYVTPGWDTTLAAHLRRDRTIGLIGPVTNNIGNEAKVDLAYAGMHAMLDAAAAHTRRHLGQIVPLHTAAFFCVMMRRDVYERVGPIDESFGRGFFEDDDYCRRVEELGLRVVCAEDVFVHHELSASFNKVGAEERTALFERNKAIYERKWGRWVPHVYRDDVRASSRT